MQTEAKERIEFFVRHGKKLTFVIALLIMFTFVAGAQASPKVGDIIPFGEWDWRVLDVRDGRALIITESIIERRPYNVHDKEVTWETCTLRAYLNGEFLQKFTAEDQRRIAETKNRNPDNLWYGTTGGNDTTDKIFLLSLEEVDKYFGNSGDYENKRNRVIWDNDSKRWVPADDGYGFLNANDGTRVAKYNDEVREWWLRSPGRISSRAADVYGDGYVSVGGLGVARGGDGVRPALWLILN